MSIKVTQKFNDSAEDYSVQNIESWLFLFLLAERRGEKTIAGILEIKSKLEIIQL